MMTATLQIATVTGTRTDSFNFRVRPGLVRISGLTPKDSGLAVDVKNEAARMTGLDLNSPVWNDENGFWEAAIAA